MTVPRPPADTYAAARARFVAATDWPGVARDRCTHQETTGPDSEALSIDTAWFGPRDARKVLVSICGTHGQEGFAGSAIQCGWIGGGGAGHLPPDTAVFLIHGLNPYGWAHFSRTNENNVDLNRNFVRFDPPPFTSPLIHEIDTALRIDHPTLEKVHACWDKLTALMAEHGPDLVSVISGGQYVIADMTNYGGAAPQWSNVQFRALLAKWCGHASRVAFLDLHTGVGAFGEPFFLVFNDKAGPDFARAESWWGPDVRAHASGNDGMPPVAYRGLVWHGAVETLANAALTGGVIEFGTYPPVETMGALVVDQWLRRTPGIDPQTRAEWTAWQFSRLNPDDPAWLDTVVAKGRVLHDQALAGLAAWA